MAATQLDLVLVLSPSRLFKSMKREGAFMARLEKFNLGALYRQVIIYYVYPCYYGPSLCSSLYIIAPAKVYLL